MRWRSALVVMAGSIGAAMACRRPPADTAAALPPEAATDEVPDAEQAIAPARCHPTSVAIALDDGHGVDELEIGDAVSYPGGYAVGLVRRTPAGRTAAVALLNRDLEGLEKGTPPAPPARARDLTLVDLGPTLGDAPPPRVGWRAPDLVAAAYVRSNEPRGESRDMALYTIAGTGPAAAPVVVSQQRDDSLAFDLAFAGSTGLLAWDEATSASRGVVRAASFSKDRALQARDISPPSSDAELPRVLPVGSRFAVIWIARRPEAPHGVDASVSEVTGEPRSYGWLEAVTVDAQGAPTGPVRSLTQPSGHVSAFDAEVRSVDAAPLLVVVARDDGEIVDGSGGALLRVRMRGDVIEPPVAFATDGLGRGAPTFVSSSAAGPSSPFALAWVGKEEQARCLPLDGSGAPASAVRAEDAMNDARPLLFLDSHGIDATAQRSQLLVATPADVAAQLRAFACDGAR